MRRTCRGRSERAMVLVDLNEIKAGVYQLVSTVNGQAITQSIVIE
jgi:hypothetical protein